MSLKCLHVRKTKKLVDYSNNHWIKIVSSLLLGSRMGLNVMNWFYYKYIFIKLYTLVKQIYSSEPNIDFYIISVNLNYKICINERNLETTICPIPVWVPGTLYDRRSSGYSWYKKSLPAIIYIPDVYSNLNAVNEANRIGLPVLSLLNFSNSAKLLENIDYPVFCNSYSLEVVLWFSKYLIKIVQKESEFFREHDDYYKSNTLREEFKTQFTSQNQGHKKFKKKTDLKKFVLKCYLREIGDTLKKENVYKWKIKQLRKKFIYRKGLWGKKTPKIIRKYKKWIYSVFINISQYNWRNNLIKKKERLDQIQYLKSAIKFKPVLIKEEHKTRKDIFRKQQTGLIEQFKKDQRKEQRAYAIGQEKNILSSTSYDAKQRKIRNKKIYIEKKNQEMTEIVNEKVRKLHGELKTKDIETQTEIRRILIPLKMELSKKEKSKENLACWIKVWNNFCKKTYSESRLRTHILYKKFCKIFFNTQSWLFKYLWAFTKVKKFCYINFFFKKERGWRFLLNMYNYFSKASRVKKIKRIAKKSFFFWKHKWIHKSIKFNVFGKWWTLFDHGGFLKEFKIIRTKAYERWQLNYNWQKYASESNFLKENNYRVWEHVAIFSWFFVKTELNNIISNITGKPSSIFFFIKNESFSQKGLNVRLNENILHNIKYSIWSTNCGFFRTNLQIYKNLHCIPQTWDIESNTKEGRMNFKWLIFTDKLQKEHRFQYWYKQHKPLEI